MTVSDKPLGDCEILILEIAEPCNSAVKNPSGYASPVDGLTTTTSGA